MRRSKKEIDMESMFQKILPSASTEKPDGAATQERTPPIPVNMQPIAPVQDTAAQGASPVKTAHILKAADAHAHTDTAASAPVLPAPAVPMASALAPMPAAPLSQQPATSKSKGDASIPVTTESSAASEAVVSANDSTASASSDSTVSPAASHRTEAAAVSTTDAISAASLLAEQVAPATAQEMHAPLAEERQASPSTAPSVEVQSPAKPAPVVNIPVVVELQVTATNSTPITVPAMPADTASNASQEPSADAVQDLTSATAPVSDATPSVAPDFAATPIAAAPAVTEPVAIAQPSTPLAAAQSPSDAPAWTDNDIAEPVLVNLALPFLENRLDAALTKFQCCTCENCQMDVLAVALNKVRPEYVLLPKGVDPLSQVSAILARESMTALVQSIFLIKAHPRH